MEFQRIWILRGPNIWARFPVLEVGVELGAHEAATSSTLPGFSNRLLSWLSPPAGRRDALAQFLAAGVHLPDVLQRLTLELQVQAGSPVHFGLAQPAPQKGLYRVVVEFEEEALVRAALDTARTLTLAALLDQPCDASTLLQSLRDLAHQVRLGPSTRAIVRAAQKRTIPGRRLNEGSLVQLGHGVQQRRVLTAETDATPAIAQAIAQDKDLTRTLLQAVGVPVPEGRPVTDADDAWRAAEELGPPVVVKPRYGNQGRGVATNLFTRVQVLEAYAAACAESSYIVVERFAPGADHRLLVIGNRVVAAALREPAQVIGDGHSTVAELVAEVNRDPRRSDGHATSLSWIKLDAIGLAVLAEQGYKADSVPAAGVRVLIRRNGNLSTGGTATDVTDRVHPEVAARAVEAAQAVGLDIAGVDVVATDIGQPLEKQAGVVVEVNAGPGLRMHLEPSSGQGRPVGEAIVEMLYPDGQMGRIPIVAVTGVNGKTTTTRLIAHLLRRTGLFVGMTCTDGTYLDGRHTETHDCSGPRSAQSVLAHPDVQAAVLETARGGILREGLGFDWCDVSVVTNLGSGDHFGLRGIETLEDLARVKRTVVEAVAPYGTAVLNADDPLVVAMAKYCPGMVTFFSRDAAGPVLAAHRATGGRAVFVKDGSIVLSQGGRQEVLLLLTRVPLTHGGGVGFQVENVLAAVAAVWALGVSVEAIRAGLQSFRGDAEQVPGRFNVFDAGPSTIVVDYAHNPSAVSALVAALDPFPQPRRTVVFTGCNRRDDEVLGMGETLGNGFDRVILYPDQGHSGRADGELNTLLRRGLSRGKRVKEIVETTSEIAAIEQALKEQSPGQLLVLGVESIKESLTLVRRHLANQAKASL
jgi:cyanophycin synthetase